MSGLIIVKVQSPGLASQRSTPRRTIFFGEASGNTSGYLMDFSCDAIDLRLSSPLMNFRSTTCALRLASGASNNKTQLQSSDLRLQTLASQST
jgi:hypothetical protein